MELLVKTNTPYSISPSFDNTSARVMESSAYAIDAWDAGAGHDVPNNWVHKGQAKYDNDRKLLDHLNSEFINHQGMVGEYYVTTYDKNHDRVYGEDNNRMYTRKFDFMFFTDEMYEPDYSSKFSMWADNTNTLDISKVGFLAASTYGSTGDEKYIDIKNGYTADPTLRFEEYEPKIGDYVKVKAVGLFYEISNVKNRMTSLQGSSFWQLTLLPMKEERTNTVSDVNGMAEDMQNIANVGKQRQEDLDLFDMSATIEKEAQSDEYKDDTPSTITDVNHNMDDANAQDSWNKPPVIDPDTGQEEEVDGLNWS
jgi:hypothetical protein